MLLDLPSGMEAALFCARFFHSLEKIRFTRDMFAAGSQQSEHTLGTFTPQEHGLCHCVREPRAWPRAHHIVEDGGRVIDVAKVVQQVHELCTEVRILQARSAAVNTV